MKTIYDVAIIGAGPAGSCFARELAKLRPELHILLIDGQSDEQRKVCGGLLAPDAQKVLAQMGLTLPKSVLADPQIFSVETLDIVSCKTRHYQRHYINMDRYAFDRWLVSLIPSTVDVIKCRCLSADSIDGKFRLKLRHSGKDSEILSAVLVGADGAASLVRHSFFGTPPFRYTAIQQWFKSSDNTPPYSCIFDPATSDSCSWTIRKGEYILFGGAFKARDCRRAFEEQKARFEQRSGVAFGEALKTEACLLTSPRSFFDFVPGKGSVFLLGEAAGFISASSFEGISSAMLSGRLLAEAFSCAQSTEDVQKKYRRKTLKLRIKLLFKCFKRFVLCSPLLRFIIMASGIQSAKQYR